MGTYLDGNVQKRAGIFIGAELGTVQRADLMKAAASVAMPLSMC